MKLTSMILGLCLLIGSVNAFAKTKLYRGYEFGMSRSEVMNNSEVYDCSADLGEGGLCLDGQKFSGEDVDLGFRFLKDQLVSIILVSKFTQDNYLSFVGAISSKFQLSVMESGDKKFDIVAQAKADDKPVFLKKLTDFENRALARGQVKYTFIEKSIAEPLIKSSANVVDLLLKSNDDVRVAEYIVYEDNENDITSSLVQFTAPKRTLELMRKSADKNYEDF